MEIPVNLRSSTEAQRSYQVNGRVYELDPAIFAGTSAALFDVDATVKLHLDGAPHAQSMGFIQGVGLLVDTVALTTLNPLPNRARGLESVVDAVYMPRLVRTSAWTVKLLTKFDPDFYLDIAHALELETSAMAAIDNSYLAGLRAAEQAGLLTVQVRPLRGTPVHENIRPIQRLDRYAHRRLSSPKLWTPTPVTIAA